MSVVEVGKLPAVAANAVDKGAEALVASSVSNEMIFAVVGHVGSGTSEVAEELSKALKGAEYEVYILKASDVIKTWKFPEGIPDGHGLAGALEMQDAGDEMRLKKADNAAVARDLIGKIREKRALATGKPLIDDQPVEPDGQRRAYILDSLRHPEEVKALRALYQEAFVMLGVVCEAEERSRRLMKKYADAGQKKIESFMSRDADSHIPHGQLVADTFFLSDFFVDNSEPRFNVVGKVDKPNPNWLVLEDLSRLVDIVAHNKIVRPSLSETAMYHAHGARMRSACLSRQVGAALVDRTGEVVSTGCNEVPKAGGGVYDGEHGEDYRCAFHNKYCSSVREQNRIIDEIINVFPELQNGNPEDIKSRLRKSPLGGLLEFSRAVHAEMDALLSASRKGISTVACKLFVTTYPCHYCARHLIAAGVDEVQYIEPYPKSLATSLHDDAILSGRTGVYPSVIVAQHLAGAADNAAQPKVRFSPFTGVSPRLYRRAFMKERSLKDKNTGDMLLGEAVWGGSMSIRRISYVELEVKMANV